MELEIKSKQAKDKAKGRRKAKHGSLIPRDHPIVWQVLRLVLYYIVKDLGGL
jgi:hypothetical protein